MEIKQINENHEKYINEILELEKEVFGEKGAIDLWNLKPYIKYGKVFVLLQEDRVIACSELLKKWDENTVYLYGFAVKKEVSGRGIGTEFLKTILEILKNENIENVELTVALDNFGAIKLYENFGFERVKVLEKEYGIGNDRYFYRKKL